jgi:hypothetical protein
MRWRRDGSGSIMGKLGFCIDVGERLVGRSQVHLLVSSAIADGGFRLVWPLHA